MAGYWKRINRKKKKGPVSKNKEHLGVAGMYL
jgi:hypothetical protein